jgi:hypothetical protein
MGFPGNENGGEMAEFKSSFVVATTRALRRRRRKGGPPLEWDRIGSEQLGFSLQQESLSLLLGVCIQ